MEATFKMEVTVEVSGLRCGDCTFLKADDPGCCCGDCAGPTKHSCALFGELETTSEGWGTAYRADGCLAQVPVTRPVFKGQICDPTCPYLTKMGESPVCSYALHWGLSKSEKGLCRWFMCREDFPSEE